jgi:electron transfer flavoprotein beta subunit
MRICVAVKQVPRAPRGFDRRTGRLDRSGEQLLNPPDARALEAALRVREAGHDVEVVAVAMGPPRAVEALHHATALGADRAVLLSDPALEGSDLIGTSLALAAVLGRQVPDLVLFGERSEDGGCGALAAAVAERLEAPAVAGALSVTLDRDGVRCERARERGVDSVVLGLPAVVALGAGAPAARRPTVAGVMAARDAPLMTVGLADLGIARDEVGGAGARVRCGEFAPAPARPPGRVLQDLDVEVAVGEVVAWLEARGYA